ncbi:hypothetical protein D0T53_05885 [Dysgonomonas sp. 216]|uniref:hypothetical protein n=1 Tax=Dysgonomonas sp. 216 TaxID=2302934 RepID=UPI0013D21DAD|nr:hypothetical protein [Dysgonomonas sp. 216]NDW18444.1 hypothetical protein [Dysgonomonas sp. 216]
MKRVNININSRLLVLVLAIAAILVPVTAQADGAQLPSSDAYQTIQDNGTLPSEAISGSEVYAPPVVGGDPIGGKDTPIGDYSPALVFLTLGFYLLYKKRKGLQA